MLSRSGDRSRASCAPALGPGLRRSVVPGVGGVARGLCPFPGVRGGAPGQDPQEGPRRGRPGFPARRPSGIAHSTSVAGGPPDRAGVRGLRIGQDRTGLHDHLPRLAKLQPGGHAAAPSPGRDRARAHHCSPASGPAAEHAQCGTTGDRRRSAAALDVDAATRMLRVPCRRQGREVLLGPRVRRCARVLRAVPAAERGLRLCGRRRRRCPRDHLGQQIGADRDAGASRARIPSMPPSRSRGSAHLHSEP